MSTNPYQAPSTTTETKESINYSEDASLGKRFLNLIIDYACLYGIGAVVGVVAVVIGGASGEQLEKESSALSFALISYGLWISYYIVMEYSFGATIGKFLTGTRVVNYNGGKPSFWQIVGRSFARLIPFEAFSFLGNAGSGWHDTLSKTSVVLKG